MKDEDEESNDIEDTETTENQGQNEDGTALDNNENEN